MNYRTKDGNPMAVKAIVSYGDQASSARDNIATALVSATNVVSALNDGSGSKSDILPTLGSAVRERFNIPSSDDIETLAAIGNIETADLGDTEKNWNYLSHWKQMNCTKYTKKLTKFVLHWTVETPKRSRRMLYYQLCKY